MLFVSFFSACFPRIVIPPSPGSSSPSLQVRAPPATHTGWQSWLFCNIHIPVPLPIPVLQDQLQQGVSPWKPTKPPSAWVILSSRREGSYVQHWGCPAQWLQLSLEQSFVRHILNSLQQLQLLNPTGSCFGSQDRVSPASNRLLTLWEQHLTKLSFLQ